VLELPGRACHEQQVSHLAAILLRRGGDANSDTQAGGAQTRRQVPRDRR
jgi:hypothetical protein